MGFCLLEVVFQGKTITTIPPKFPTNMFEKHNIIAIPHLGNDSTNVYRQLSIYDRFETMRQHQQSTVMIIRRRNLMTL